MYLFFEILGTIAFAASGAMTAIEKKMDLLGVVILGITTAVGGGILRDLLIGSTPPAALQHPAYAFLAFGVSVLVFLPGIRKHIDLDRPFVVFIDAVGLGTFTVIGCKTGASFDNSALQIFLGVMTGVGGGVMRDVFAAEKPMIFVKHFYALASLIGAVCFTLLMPVNEGLSMLIGIFVVVVLRMLAAKYKWHLPKA